MDSQRLSKVLARLGVASRRACEKLIFAKRVRVNGVVATEPQMSVNPDVDSILVNGKPLQTSAPSQHYFMFNKPRGFVCSHNKKVHGKVIYDFFKDSSSRLFSVGRLDKDTSGLLIVTNDGFFSQKAIHPSSNITKEYLVKTTSEIIDEHLKIISAGCTVEGCHVQPVKVIKVRKGTLKIFVKEGKKREVRELVENANLTIVELKRIAIGNLRLGSLKEGSFKKMTTDEIERIFS